MLTAWAVPLGGGAVRFTHPRQRHTSPGNVVHTGQLFFHDSLTNAAYGESPSSPAHEP